MNVYLAGPMTGIEDYNYKAFVDMAKRIKEKGYQPVHTANLPRNWEYQEYMEYSKKLLEKCDAIYMLEGWESSNGANVEYALAKELGLAFISF